VGCRAPATLVLLAVLAAPVAAQVTTLSQSVNNVTIVPNNSAACTGGGAPNITTLDNGYFRSYPLASLGQPVAVVSIRFAVELVQTSAPGGFPLIIRLFNDPTGGAPSPYASLQLRHTETLSLMPAASNTIVIHPVSGSSATFLPSETLVVEVFSPAGPTGSQFFIGSNAAGQTAPTYLRSVACGVPEPTPTSSPVLGFPNMHAIIDVNVAPQGSQNPYPGTSEDFALWTAVNTGPLTAGAGNTVKTMTAGDFLTFKVASPTGMFDYEQLWVIAQGFPTGSSPPIGAAPHVHLSYPGLVFVLGGPGSPSPSLLPPGGTTLSFVVPAGAAGTSVLLQGLVLPVSPPLAANGLYASTDAHELRIL
jgi:hypothetical protein